MHRADGVRAPLFFSCLSLGLSLVALVCGCTSAPEERTSPGRVGYASDRAAEIVVSVEGDVVATGLSCDAGTCVSGEVVAEAARGLVTAREAESRAAGAPWFLARARRSAPEIVSAAARPDGRFDVHFRVELTSFARDAEHPGVGWPYPSLPGVTFDDAARESLAAPLVDVPPRVVTLLFGQMAREGAPSAGDLGWASLDAAKRGLLARGFVDRGDALVRGGVEVHLVGPDALPLHTKAASARVAESLRTSDVVYVNGHAGSGLLDDVAGGTAELVFLDTCWSYYEDAPHLRESLPEATMIVTDGVVVTGSAEGVPVVVDAAVSGGTARDVVRALNDGAEARASRRLAEGVEPELALPEVYGVVPPARR